jgi:hypothetical protein
LKRTIPLFQSKHQVSISTSKTLAGMIQRGQHEEVESESCKDDMVIQSDDQDLLLLDVEAVMTPATPPMLL